MRASESPAFSLQTILKNLPAVAIISLAGHLLFFIDPAIQILVPGRDTLGWTPKFGIPAGLMMFVATIAFINFFAKRYRGETSTVREDFVSIRGTFWSAAFTATAYAGLIGMSLFAFVLPAFWTAAVFSLALVATVLVRDSATNPFRLSRDLTRGHFLTVARVSVVAWAVQGLPIVARHLPIQDQLQAIAAAAISMVTMPFAIGCQVALFLALTDQKAADGQSPAPRGTRLSGLPAFFGTLGLVLLALIALAAAMFGLRQAQLIPAINALMLRSFPNSPAILANGVEFDVPSGWSLRQRDPNQIWLTKLSNTYIKTITITASSEEFMPKSFRGRPMDAAFFREYVMEQLLRPAGGAHAETLLHEESFQAGARTWTILSYEAGARDGGVWKYFLTSEGDQLISLTLGHTSTVADRPRLQQEIDEVKACVSSMRARGQVTVWNRTDEMEPLIHPGDWVLVTPYGPGEVPKRGDIVAYHARHHIMERYILRVHTLPGEITNDENGHPLPPVKNAYYLLADNVLTEQHKRPIGPVGPERIMGYVSEIYAPVKHRRTLPGRSTADAALPPPK